MSLEVRALTPEEKRESERLESLYNYYGLPQGLFSEIDPPRNVILDWNTATILLMRGERIPKDLEERLLRYKKKGYNRC